MYWLMVCGIQMRSQEDWDLVNSWFPLHYIHEFGMVTAFVATEDKTEVLTVVIQAQLLLGYVVMVSEAEFGLAVEKCADAAPPPPTNALVITAHDWKAYMGNETQNSFAGRQVPSQASETLVEGTECNEDMDSEQALNSFADFDSDSDLSSDEEDDEDEDEDEDGDMWLDGSNVYSFDGVVLDDLNGNKQVRAGRVLTLAMVDSACLSLFEGLGIPASSSAGFLL